MVSVFCFNALGNGQPSSTLPISLGISPDALPALLETVEQSTPIDADSLPLAGTFYSAQNLGWPPLPSDIIGVPAWDLGNEVYLLSDLDFDYSATQPEWAMGAARFSPMGDPAGGGSHSTNDFWLEMTALDTNSASFVVHTPQAGVFDLFFTTNIGPANWYWIARGLPDQTNFTVWSPDANSGFFITGTTNGTDADGLTAAYRALVGGTNTLINDLNSNGIPDYWEILNFGDLSQSATNDYDGDGTDNLLEYQNGTDPNKITFSFWFSPQYVSQNSATGSVQVLNGVPASMAVLTDSTNFASAVWQPYNPNFVAALGTNDGEYTVWLGLRGRLATSQQTWQIATVTRDTVPPVLVITNPVSGVTARPILQLQGYSTEPLQSLSFDITNAAGSLLAQPGYVIHQQVDTNSLKLSTNWFQCYDIALTNGNNAITLRATDLAGNVTTTNIAITLDPSVGTNPPAITVVWPPNQSPIAGTNLSLRGILDDDTATISVSVAGTNIPGTVERGGTFRVPNIPLGSSTNVLTLAATNAAGYGSTLQWAVLESGVQATVDTVSPTSLSQAYLTVTGTVSDTNETLLVNGVQATINGDFTWEADNVPVLDHNGTADFDLTISPTNNPTVASGVDSVAVTMPSVVRPTAYTETYNQSFDAGGALETWTLNRTWEEGVGGTSRQHYANAVGVECDSELTYPDFWPDGQTVLISFCTGTEDIEVGLPWLYYNLQAAGAKTVNDNPGTTATQYSDSRSVDTSLELTAAGPAQAGVMRLILLTVSAAGYSDPLPFGYLGGNLPSLETQFEAPGDEPIPAGNISVLGQALTPTPTNSYVGQVLMAAPAGSVQTLPVTVTGANSQAYSLNVQAEDVKMTIYANGIDLSTNTPEFCVGQQVIFSNSFSSPLVNVTSRVAKWTLDGNYVNNYTQPASSASTNYFADPTLLTNLVVSNWWVTGGTGPANNYVVRFAENLTLGGGRQVVVITNASFDIYQPTLTNWSVIGSATLSVYYSGGERLGVGDADGGGAMAFETYVSSQYSGLAGFTQVYDDESYPDSLGSNVLDIAQFYPYPGPPLTTVITNNYVHNVVALNDGPWETCYGGINSAALLLQFRDYARFRPDAGTPSQNIFVTLGKATWNVSAGATFGTNGWVLNSNSTITGPDFTPSSEWPFWTTTH